MFDVKYPDFELPRWWWLNPWKTCRWLAVNLDEACRQLNTVARQRAFGPRSRW